MKKILTVLILMMTMVVAFATPRLEGNKILLDEAVTSLFTAEEFIEMSGGEEALDIVDDFGHTKRQQLEFFCNPNKVIEFATEEFAAECYNALLEANLQPEDLYVMDMGSYENLDFWLFWRFLNKYAVSPTYCYVGE